MRVTKLIKNYVEESVNAIYNPQIDAVGEEYFARRDAVQAIINEKVAAQVKELDAIVAESGFEYQYNHMSRYNENLQFHNTLIQPSELDAITVRKARLREEKKKAIENILLTLELGGTKADLDKMLAEIKISA